jgi:lantibiotic transport system permease protein
MNLSISLRSEISKTKRTAAIYFTLIGAAVIPFIFLVNAISEGHPGDERSNKDSLNGIFKMSSEMTGLVIFPLFVVLICTLLPQTEYRNNAWKQVLTSPQSKASVFMAKFLNIQLLLLTFLVASHWFMWLIIFAIHFMIPKLNLLHQPMDGYKILLTNVHCYLTILAVSAIQFWIGLRFKNFLIPIAIGLVLWIMGMMMKYEYHSSFTVYFPYSFSTFTFHPPNRAQLAQVEWTSFGLAIFFLLTGFLDFRRRRMNE